MKHMAPSSENFESNIQEKMNTMSNDDGTKIIQMGTPEADVFFLEGASYREHQRELKQKTRAK